MLLDKALEFSDQQAVTASAVGSNVFDLSEARHIGDGKPLWMHFLVEEAAAAAGAATVDFEIVTDDNEALSSPTVIATTGSIGKATLVAGYEFYLQLPPGATYERYLGVQYTVATGPLTAGKFTAHIVENPPFERQYPDNVNIT